MDLALLNIKDAIDLSRFAEQAEEFNEDLSEVRQTLNDVRDATRKVAIQQKASTDLRKTINTLKDIRARADVERTRKMVDCLIGT